MIFRLSFIHGLYVIPGWYIVQNFSTESISRMLGAFFSAVILLAVFQIRLRRRINGRAEREVADALLMYPPAKKSAPGGAPVNITQSFSFEDYRKMNIEVMFTYLRPWLTAFSGVAFLVIVVFGFIIRLDPIRLGLSVMLALYFLALPWLMFHFRVKRAYRAGESAMTSQEISISEKEMEVRVGESVRQITILDDIAVTGDYLFLFTAGSNYVQIRRDSCSESEQMMILARSARMVDPA